MKLSRSCAAASDTGLGSNLRRLLLGQRLSVGAPGAVAEQEPGELALQLPLERRVVDADAVDLVEAVLRERRPGLEVEPLAVPR